MSRKFDRDLQRLQEELLAAEEADDEEYEEAYEEPEEYEEDLEDTEEEESDDYHYADRYGRGSPRRFEDRDFFEDDVADEEVLLKKDYKKAKRKKARQKFGLMLLLILELLGLGAIVVWWASWSM